MKKVTKLRFSTSSTWNGKGAVPSRGVIHTLDKSGPSLGYCLEQFYTTKQEVNKIAMKNAVVIIEVMRNILTLDTIALHNITNIQFAVEKEINQVVDWSKVDKDDYLMAMERSSIKDI